MKKVNTFIIGAQKAGTTSLYYYLRQHPNIYFSEVKEVTYFKDDKLYSKGQSYFHSFFPNYNNEKIVASSFVEMLACEKCPKRVQKYNPDMKFIVILRDPVQRAYSAYNYACQRQWEDADTSFIEALKREYKFTNQQEQKEFSNKLKYIHHGLYHKHLSLWLKYFNQDQFLILKFSELKENPKVILSDIYDFLNISYFKIDISKKYNKTGKVRFSFIRTALNKLKSSEVKSWIGKFMGNRLRLWIRGSLIPKIKAWNVKEKSYRSLTEHEYKFVLSYFKEDMRKLEKEFGIKLP